MVKFNTVATGWRPPGTIVDRVSKVRSVSSKISRIGTTNRDVLNFLHDLPEGVDATEQVLLSVDLGSTGIEADRSSRIAAIEPSERFYRISFLISVGLVVRDSNVDGEAVYRVSENVRKHIDRV